MGWQDLLRKKNLARYVKNNDSHKKRKDVFYLQCSNMDCKQTRLLEPELINWYFESTCIGCPQKDGGELKGRVGQYGLISVFYGTYLALNKALYGLTGVKQER